MEGQNKNCCNPEVLKPLIWCAGIDSLFNKINCDRTAIDDMLGAASGVTDNNMLQYLGIIEQRTNELLAVQTYLNIKVSLRSYWLKLVAIVHTTVTVRTTHLCYLQLPDFVETLHTPGQARTCVYTFWSDSIRNSKIIIIISLICRCEQSWFYTFISK